MTRQCALKEVSDKKDYSPVIRSIHKLLLQGKKDSTLFRNVCKEIQVFGKYKLVWIGLLNGISEGLRTVEPIAFFCPDDFSQEYAEELIKISNNTDGLLSWSLKSKKHRIFSIDDIQSRFSFPLKKIFNKGHIGSLAVMPLKYNNSIIGLLNIYSSNIHSFNKDETKMLREVAKNISTDTRGMKLEIELKNTMKQLERALYETIDAITLMSEIKDPYTSGHQKKVALLASTISKELGLPKNVIDGIYVSGLLHDVGKISVPNDILAKPGQLNEGEFIIVKNHPVVSYDILKSIEFPWSVADIVQQHHEKINGSGYPKGLKDKDIRIEARILAVADVVEAMTAHRPYRPALGLKKAIKEIIKNKNKLYDEKIVDACIDVLEKKKIKL
jgi:putative nucleotidyltransferase with HDIG domain